MLQTQYREIVGDKRGGIIISNDPYMKESPLGSYIQMS
jgi:hypothetical protein